MQAITRTSRFGWRFAMVVGIAAVALVGNAGAAALEDVFSPALPVVVGPTGREEAFSTTSPVVVEPTGHEEAFSPSGPR